MKIKDTFIDSKDPVELSILTELISSVKNRLNHIERRAVAFPEGRENLLYMMVAKAGLQKLNQIVSLTSSLSLLYEKTRKIGYSYDYSLDNEKISLSNAFQSQDQIEQLKDDTVVRREMRELTNSLEMVYRMICHMSAQIYEQGNMIDRIDYSIQNVRETIQKGNAQLMRAIEHEESGIANSCIKVMSFLVILFTFLLMLKFFE